MSTKRYYVINCVKHNGVYLQKDAPLDLDEGIAKSLLKSNAITSRKPETGEAAPVAAPVQVDEFVNPFADMEIEDKVAKILVTAGIKTEEELGEESIETLMNIDGIGKATATKLVDMFE